MPALRPLTFLRTGTDISRVELMRQLTNLLLIAGTGRNTGKTTLACSIIKKFSADLQIIGLKISPHFHGGTDSLKLLKRSEFYNIYEETSIDSGKDSSKMLNAGAFKVLYIETLDEHLLPSFEQFLELAPTGYPVVCESPALRRYINPGIFIIVDSSEKLDKKIEVLSWKKNANWFCETDRNSIYEIIENITIENNTWKQLKR